MSDRTIAFIGLGNMGTPMSSKLIEAGYSVRGFDLASDARDRLEEAGGNSFDSARAAAEGADIVLLMLPGSAVVNSVVDELLEVMPAGTLVIDMSSSEPLATRELSSKLATHGVDIVDAPVSGGVAGAAAGKLTVMAGGDDGAIQSSLPVLNVFGHVVLCGPAGAGHAVKALNNLLSATHLWATSQTIEVGRRFGLDAQTMLDVFNSSSGRSGSTENKWPNYIIPGTFDSGFALRLMLKDMRIAQNLGRAFQVEQSITDAAVNEWSVAAESLADTADHTEVASFIAKRDSVERGDSLHG